MDGQDCGRSFSLSTEFPSTRQLPQQLLVQVIFLSTHVLNKKHPWERNVLVLR